MAPSRDSFLTTLAWYNREANEAMATILAEHHELLHVEGRAYYGSIMGVLSHITIADITWLRRVGASDADDAAVLALEFDGLADTPFSGFDAWRRHRGKADALIESYCGGLSPAAAKADVEYRTSKGVAFRQPRWQLLLHMFNHQTHHRGQVAQILDEEGVENDFSNLVWYLRD